MTLHGFVILKHAGVLTKNFFSLQVYSMSQNRIWQLSELRKIVISCEIKKCKLSEPETYVEIVTLPRPKPDCKNVRDLFKGSDRFPILKGLLLKF